MTKTTAARAATSTAAPEASKPAAPVKAARPKGTLRAVEGTAAAHSEPVKKTGKAAAPDQPTPVKVRPGLAPTIRIKPGEKVREDGLPEGGIDAKLVDAVLADGGALHSELNALTGWKKSDRRLARAAQVAGVTLTKTREGGDTRFIGTRAATKAT